MTMNESFFGQYSVFCVFGSVVGCVVVPLIAQVLQQQSMECMILSAIVISLTAAHLNKKGGHETSNSKILITKELEKKKMNHNNNNNKKQRSHGTHSHHSQQYHQEQEYMQQHEHLKVVETERRNEEKRLKKLKKREERLKKREEETKKQKELEERYRNLKEKRIRQQKENYSRTNKKYLNSSMACLEKYCGSEYMDKKRSGLTPVDENKAPKQAYVPSNQQYQQGIPRFERNRTPSFDSSSSKSPCHSGRSVTTGLTIRCSNLSASCSSLSSISSSGSASPPLPSSPPPCNNTAWKLPGTNHDPTTATGQPQWLRNITAAPSCYSSDQALRSYSNVRSVKSNPAYKLDSSSLFCTQQDKVHKPGTGSKKDQASFNGEYSLFGPQQFGSSFVKSPIV